MKKYRIFDKIENSYIDEPDYRWMLSRNERLYNSELDEWYDIGIRYDIEFSTSVMDINNIELYVGDKCSVDGDYCGDYYELGFDGTIMYNDGSFYILDERGDGIGLNSSAVQNRNIKKLL